MKKLKAYFTKSGELEDGTRFEIGDEVPKLSDEILSALIDMDAIEVK